MLRSQLYADPHGRFIHDVVLGTCDRFPHKTAIVDASGDRRLTYAEYGEAVQLLARGLSAAGFKPGEVLAIYLPNSWEFCIAFHSAMLAGGVPTPINPHYRERELSHQLEDSGASLLITNGAQISGMNLASRSLRQTWRKCCPCWRWIPTNW